MADSLLVLLDRLAARPVRFGLLLATTALIGTAAIGILGGLPLPKVHDEFSYLLASDTFASGRIANPTHPMWEHFETFHVIHEPTYVSKYPPAQGLFLAIGQVLTGKPIVGVWISVALMCWAFYWMFQAWLPPRWAVVGGFLTVFQIGITSYWAQSYWGGAVAALGGALLFGSVRHLADAPRISHGLLLGLGLGILANSRPFEGLVAGIFAAGALLAIMLRVDRAHAGQLVRKGLAPALGVLVLVAGAMGFYNLRTTGDPLVMPYQVHSRTYSASSFAPWKAARPAPEYRHETMRRFYIEYGDERLKRQREAPAFIAEGGYKLLRLHIFYLGVLGLLPLLGLRGALRAPWTRFAFGTAIVVIGLSLFTNGYPHYVAPVAGLILVVTTAAMQHLWLARWRGVNGMTLVKITAVLFVASFWTSAYLRADSNRRTYGFAQQRAEVVADLGAKGGEHLVIVRYRDGHHFFSEWVFNRASIDEATVVWARDMGPDRNEALIDYFSNRSVWLLTAGPEVGEAGEYAAEDVVLAPYSTAVP